MSRPSPGTIALFLLAFAAAAQVVYLLTRPEPVRLSAEEVQPGGEIPQVRLSSLGAGPAPSDPTLYSLVRLGCSVAYFWDPSCPACDVGAPHWSDRQALDHVDQVVWITSSRDAAAIDHFVEHHRIRMPLLQLPAGATMRDAGVTGVPTAWVVKDGQLRWSAQGALSTSPDSVATRVSELCGDGDTHTG